MVGSLHDHLNQDGEGNLFRRKDYFSSSNWSSSNLPSPLLLLLLLLHYPWLNNCHRTFYRRHVDRYRCTYPCAQMVSSVLVKSLVHTSTSSEIIAFYRGLVEDPKKRSKVWKYFQFPSCITEKSCRRRRGRMVQLGPAGSLRQPKPDFATTPKLSSRLCDVQVSDSCSLFVLEFFVGLIL